MKIIRWPAVCAALLILLIGFVLISFSDNPTVHRNFEYLASRTFSTPVNLGTLQLDVSHSHIRLEELSISDPENKARNLFTAGIIDLQAEPAAFFEKRVALSYVDASNVFATMYQLKNGRFDILSPAARAVVDMEPTSLKVKRLTTWAADRVNPVSLLTDPRQEQTGPDDVAPLEPAREKNNAAHSPPRRDSGFALAVPQSYPDLIVHALNLTGCSLLLHSSSKDTSLFLHGLTAVCRELSSRPKVYAQPVSFSARSYVGDGTGSWFTVSGSFDISSGKTNISLIFELNDIAILPCISFARTYTPYVDMLAISSGRLSAKGTFTLKDGLILPGTLYLHAQDFSARASGNTTDLEWLNSLSVTDADFDLLVPIDNIKPYVHFDTAVKQQNIRIKKMKNIELKIKTDQLKSDFLR